MLFGCRQWRLPPALVDCRRSWRQKYLENGSHLCNKTKRVSVLEWVCSLHDRILLHAHVSNPTSYATLVMQRVPRGSGHSTLPPEADAPSNGILSPHQLLAVLALMLGPGTIPACRPL